MKIPWKSDYAVCDKCNHPSPADYVDIGVLVPQINDLEAENKRLREAEIIKRLREHIDKGDMVDVFAWNQGDTK